MNIAKVGARGALLALVAAFVSAGTASAATDAFASSATAYQNSTVASALARAPSGQRVAPGVVEWANYSVVMAVPKTRTGTTASMAVPTGAAVAASPDVLAAGTGGCPSGVLTKWNCVYSQTGFGGTRLQFKDSGYYQDLWYWGGGSWVTKSYSNTRGYRGWLNQYANHNASGESLCMNPHSAMSDTSHFLASLDRWIYLSKNSAPCPGT